MEPSGQRHFVLSPLSVALALSPVCALAVLKTDLKFSRHSSSGHSACMEGPLLSDIPTKAQEEGGVNTSLCVT